MNARILLVDDEPTFLILMGDFLRLQGYVVDTAEDGQQALEKMRADGPFDLIISDIYMPQLNGIELHCALRKIPEFVNVPFLFISGHADPSTLSAVEFSVNDKFLVKSTEPVKLREWINYLLTPVQDRKQHPAEDRSSGLKRGEFRRADSGHFANRR